MNKRVSKLIVFNLAIIMLLSLIPSKTLASNENNQLDYEHIDKKSYLNEHKPMVKVLADANSKEEANKQIKNPEQKKTYTMFAEYLVNRNGKKVSAFQPYRATVGESDTIPNIDHQIELPELYGYQKPVDIFKFNYQYIKDHDVATNGPLFHVYNNHKLKIKIKHSFQSLYNKDDFSTIPEKYTTQEVNIGDLVRAIPLPEDQRPGFVPERNIVETVIPDVKDFVMEIRYLRKKVNVIYDTDGGNDIPAKLAIYGQTITAVDPPVKEGSVFEGWEINQDLSKIDNDGTIKDKLYQKGQKTGINKSDSEFKDATPNQDVVFKAKWHDKERTNYAISFWCEKADYDEQEVEKLKKAGDSSYLLKKYDYVGSNIIKDVLSNSRPNLKDIFPNNIVFPDLDNANDMTKDNLPKYYHLNEGLSQEINKEKNGPEIKRYLQLVILITIYIMIEKYIV